MISAIRFAVLAFTCSAIASHVRAADYLEFHAYDPAYNGGAVLDNSFAAAGQHYGEKAALLADGSTVVVGLVPGPGQSATQPGGNIGLVHYSAAGARIAWSNPTAAYASYYNIYLTFPNNASATFSRIDDVKISGDYIYVMADDGTPISTYIHIFSSTGQYVATRSAFTGSSDEPGAGLAPYTYTVNLGGGPVTLTNMMAAASQNNGTASQPDYVVVMHNYPVNADGTLGTAFSGFGSSGTATFALPEPICSNGPNPCSGLTTNVTAVRANTNTPTVYVLGTATTHFQPSGGQSAFILAVNVNGQLDSGFGGPLAIPMDSQFAGHTFGLIAQATGTDITGDVLYAGMGSDSATGCHTGGGVIDKIVDTQNGFDVDSTWGNNGSAYACNNTNGPSFEATSMASDGTRLVVAGFGPGFASIRQSDGTVLDIQILWWLRANGTRWDGGTWNSNEKFGDVIAVAPGKFIVAGTLCDSTRGASCPAFGTTQLISDRIFADGFDGG